MNNPQSQRQVLLKIQSDANCDRFPRQFRQVLHEWNRSVEEWTRYSDMVANFPSDELEHESKKLLVALTKSFQQILVLNHVQSKISNNVDVCQAVEEYCRDAEGKLAEGNDRLLQSYNHLLHGEFQQSEKMKVYVSSAFEGCYELLKRANDRIEKYLTSERCLQRTIASVLFVGGNAAIWGFGYFYHSLYTQKFPLKIYSMLTLVGASFCSLYFYKSLNNPVYHFYQYNKCSKELNHFLKQLTLN